MLSTKVSRRTGARVRKDAPRVGVVIPNYNTATFIAETLESVLAQAYTDYEIVVVNDAAPDTKELKEVLEPPIVRITWGLSRT